MKREPESRSRRLQGLAASIIGLAALAGLMAEDDLPPKKNERPPLSGGALASYRPDGGQMLSPQGHLPPNVLSGLNLGQAVELKSSHPAYLSHLPSLGPGSAARAVASGCLSKRQRSILNGLVIESCKQNKP